MTHSCQSLSNPSVRPRLSCLVRPMPTDRVAVRRMDRGECVPAAVNAVRRATHKTSSSVHRPMTQARALERSRQRYPLFPLAE